MVRLVRSLADRTFQLRSLQRHLLGVFRKERVCTLDAASGDVEHSGFLAKIKTGGIEKVSESTIVAESLRRPVVDFLLLALSDVIVQFYGSTFSQAASEYGLLPKSLCPQGKRLSDPARPSHCRGIGNIWCTEAACPLLQNPKGGAHPANRKMEQTETGDSRGVL